MAARKVTLTDEAHERLEARRRDDESFSDVVLRLTHRERMKGFGAMAGVEGFREAVESFREEFDRDFEERQRKLFDR